MAPKKLPSKKPFKFSWKTPERRIGETALPLIANEVYLAIFDHLELSDNMDSAQRAEHRAALSNLALVCRFFCAECLPRIFKSMEYSGLAHSGSTPSYVKFCRDLCQGEETACYLGQHVKECSVTHWMQAVEEGQWVFGNFLKLYIKSITRLVELEILHLHDTPIDLKFLAGLGTLEKLKSLKISYCDFQSLTKDDQCLTGSLKLVHFELFVHRNDALLIPLAQIVSSRFLRTLRTDNWGFLRALMSQTIDFSIETLTIPISIPEVVLLQKFLDKNQSITDLSIHSFQSIRLFDQLPHSILGLAPSSLPRLSRLECPPCLMADFVPGRPLKSIKINPRIMGSLRSLEDAERDEKSALSVLKQSTAAITLLRVPGNVYAAASFDDVFPRLETLILDISFDHELVHHPETINKICAKWPRSPSINSLHLNFGRAPTWKLDLPLQLSMVSGIASAFPTVLLVRITDNNVEWRRHHRQNEEWRPFVLSDRKAALKAILKDRLSENPDPVKDYGGCFTALFHPSSPNDTIYLRHLGAKWQRK